VSVRLNFFPQVFLRNFAIFEDLSEQSATDCLASVDWNYGASAVGMTQEATTSFDVEKHQQKTLLGHENTHCFL